MQVIRTPSSKHDNILDARRLSLEQHREQLMDSQDNPVLTNFFLPRFSSEYRLIIHSLLGVSLGTITGYSTYYTNYLHLEGISRAAYTLRYFLGSISIVLPFVSLNEVYYGMLKRWNIPQKYLFCNSLAGMSTYYMLYLSTQPWHSTKPTLPRRLRKYCLVLTVGSLFMETLISAQRFLIKNKMDGFNFKPSLIFRQPPTPKND